MYYKGIFYFFFLIDIRLLQRGKKNFGATKGILANVRMSRVRLTAKALMFYNSANDSFFNRRFDIRSIDDLTLSFALSAVRMV